MPFQKLENIKDRHPKLSQKLDSLAAYITRQIDGGTREIEPVLASQSLHLREIEVLALLMLLEEAGIVRHAYNIHCVRQGTLLQTVNEKREIARVIYCKYCDKDHREPDDFEIELIFQILEQASEPLRHNVAVS